MSDSSHTTAAMPPWVKRAILWFWLTALAAFYFVGVLRALHDLLIMLFLSLFVSFAVEPAVNFLERRGIRRGYATVIVLLSGIISAAAMTAAVGRALVEQTQGLVDQAPVYLDNAEDWINDTLNVDISFDALSEEFIQGGGVQNLVERFGGDIPERRRHGCEDTRAHPGRCSVHLLFGRRRPQIPSSCAVIAQ